MGMSVKKLEGKMESCKGGPWDSEVPLMKEVADHLKATSGISDVVLATEEFKDWKCSNVKKEDKDQCLKEGCKWYEANEKKACHNIPDENLAKMETEKKKAKTSTKK